MKKKEKQPGDLIPVFGKVYNITKPEELQKALEIAKAKHEQALAAQLQATRHLERCKLLLNCLTIEENFRNDASLFKNNENSELTNARVNYENARYKFERNLKSCNNKDKEKSRLDMEDAIHELRLIEIKERSAHHE